MAEGEEGGRIELAIEDGVAEVRLNRPAKMNALDRAMFEALIDTGETLAATPGLRAVVLSGEGRGFCAGLDMESFAASGDGAGLADLTERTHGNANLFQRAALVWRDLPMPVIAALHGVALGGGLQIALGADLRYAAADTRLSVLEVAWGLVPDMGGILLMRRLMRADIVRELTYTGRILSGTEAASLGLVTAIHDDPLAAARAAARAIAGRSPEAVRAAKALFNAAEDADAAEILRAESAAQAALIGAPNQIEAVRANLARRPPVFRDVDPPVRTGAAA